MPNEQEPVTPVTETVSVPVNGSQAGEQSAQPTVTQPEVTPDIPQNNELDEWRKRAEEAEKKANQAAMRANQLENERREAERKRLEEANQYKELYEQELADRTAREEQEKEAKLANEARSLRDSVIDSYADEKVKAAAKKLVGQNDSYFYWGDNAQTKEDAQAQVKAQLDALAETFGTPAVPEREPIIDGNNPVEGRNSTTSEDLKAWEDRIANVVV